VPLSIVMGTDGSRKEGRGEEKKQVFFSLTFSPLPHYTTPLVLDLTLKSEPVSSLPFFTWRFCRHLHVVPILCSEKKKTGKEERRITVFARRSDR
jgi:hypothetical protein